MSEEKPQIEILNRRASHQYKLGESFEAGLQLKGTEIKSIRAGKVNLKDAWCHFQNGELYVKDMHIAEYKYSTYDNHEEKRERKLLLKKSELRKLHRKLTEKGFSLIPIRLFVNKRGLAKLDIALAEGKKSYDKRESIKEKDQKRELRRIEKYGL